eukprot:m.36272 g.36272  ORF g.36272 m.36272 type:complete len:2392 (+) comp5381_c0_seq2:48-7223(+)
MEPSVPSRMASIPAARAGTSLRRENKTATRAHSYAPGGSLHIPDTAATAPFGMRRVTAESMLGEDRIVNGRRQGPSYDPLSDPHLAPYYARKFGWTVAAIPASASASGRGRSATARHVGECQYKVTTKTGPRSSAPRSACKKSVTFVGTKGEHGPCALAGPGLHFRPGAEDTFTIEGRDVGTLTHVVVRSDCHDRQDGWLLESLRVSVRGADGEKREAVTIPCETWLSTYHGDRLLEITLKVPNGEGSGPNNYELEIHTGSQRGAGTDANVFVTLHGEKGSSARTNLRAAKAAFECGSVDHFTITTPRLGKLLRLVVEHDNAGLAPGWFLERIIVTHAKTARRYIFPCSQWLAKNEGDGKIQRELVPLAGADGASAMYQVNTFTGDVRYGGTSANVAIILYGDKADSGELPLTGVKNAFDRGKESSFAVTSAALGELKRVRISHDNSGSGPGWFLERVEVTEMLSGKKYLFPCGRWLATDEDDGQTSRELACNTGTAGTIPYQVHIVTGDKMGAATSAEVFCVLYGSKGASGRVKLENSSKNFQRNRTDVFTVECSELGNLLRMDLGHDNSGLGAAWYVERVSVDCPTLGKRYSAPVQQWFSAKEGDGKIERTITFDEAAAQKFEKQSVWICTVHTGDVLGAGTNAHVFMVAYGDKGKSDEQPLVAKNDLFERNQVDEFKLALERIGRPYKIRVWHDNRGLAAAWFLDYIELRHSDSGAVYRFDCGQWLSLKDGGDIVKELPATGELVKTPGKLLPYTVRVFTGRKRGSGTDANVFVNIYGTLGDTGSRQLRKSGSHLNKFESGQCDDFVIAAVDLGVLEKIRVGHDNSGPSPGWYVERIEVERPDPLTTWTFPCDRWFAKDEDDGQIERELPVLGANGVVKATTTYTVSVATGDVPKAGTDANVFVNLFGAKGETGALKLVESTSFRNKFERGHIDIFKLEAVDIGELKKIRVLQDGSGVGSDWFLDTVEVEVASLGKKYHFKCGRWFSKSRDDGMLERDLLPDADTLEAVEAKVPYEVQVQTSDVKGAGTDANVYVAVYGDKGKTDEIYLDNKTNNFERGQLDVFKIEIPDIGTPYKLRVGHDNKGLGAAWHLDNIVLRNLATETHYTFVANRWLSKKDGDKQIVVELPVTRAETIDKTGKRVLVKTKDAGLLTYQVAVKTGDVLGAGTDANVYVVLYGENGDSGERKLEHSLDHRNKFERKQTDTFEIEAVNLGALHRVKVWHDNKGLNAGWFLDSIDVTDPATAKTYSFPCGRWFDKSQDDGLIVRELGLTGAGPAELQTNAVQHNYDVHVFTGDVRYAGTDANVFVVLYGDKADSGKVPLLTSKTNRNKFERGKEDQFTVACADLGDLKKLRIGHDGSGVGAGWHLDRVVVHDVLGGKTWTFPCERWFDTSKEDGAIERELAPDAAVEQAARRVPYEAVFYTSDIRHAGTNAHVYIDVYGKAGKAGKEAHDHIDIVNTHSKSFERGSVDRFPIQLLDIGAPFKVRVGHDGTGIGAGWHLNKIVLINQETKEGYEFICDRWLAKDEDDGEIVRELPLTTKLTAAKDGQAVKRTEVAIKKIVYKVHVYTGDKFGAGTDANVSVVIKGSNGDTGPRELKDSEQHRNKFERNQLDTFEIEAVDLGDLEEVKVWHDNSGAGASWFLDRIEVEAEGGAKSVFPCNRWLSKSEDDKEISRTLPIHLDPAVAAARAAQKAAAEAEEKRERAAELQSRSSSKFKREKSDVSIKADARPDSKSLDGKGPASKGIVKYRLVVCTGDCLEAGTDAVVTVEIIGRRRVKKDKGFSYEGTSSGRVALSAAKHEFERGRADTFEFDSPDVGTPTRLIIGHDDTGSAASWFLDKVELTMASSERTYVFPCNAWLSSTKADKQTERTLLPLPQEASPDSVQYEIVIVTGKDDGAGCAVPLSLWLYGEDGSTEELVLAPTTGGFEQGHADTFVLDLYALGMLTKARIGYQGKKKFSWLLEKIVVRCLADQTSTTFPCNLWFGKESADKLCVRELSAAGTDAKAQVALKSKVYKIYVVTGRVANAGTDANVSVILFGELGDSGEIKLTKSETHSNKFEGGNTDVFEQTCTDLGHLSKIRIWHDNKGFGASWFLERVEVVEEDTTSRYLFPCSRWLSKSEDDKQIVRELACAQGDVKGYTTQYKITVITADKPGAETSADVLLVLTGSDRMSDEIVLSNGGKHFKPGQTDTFFETIPMLGTITGASVRLGDAGRKWLLEQMRVTDVRSGLTQYFVARKPVTTELMTMSAAEETTGKAAATRALESVTYELSVYTSDVSGAGTDANVYVKLFGDNGDTGDRELHTSSTHKNKFERNQTDVFTLEALDLGALKKLVVWHDNKGLGAAWHLGHISVKNTASGVVTTFPCKQWLSKSDGDKQLLRELVPE